MKRIFMFSLMLLSQLAVAPAYAEGGEGNGLYEGNDAPYSIRVINFGGGDVGPAPACPVGFEAVYDVGYGRWTCVPVTGGGGGGE